MNLPSETITFSRIRNVKLPTRGTKRSAGIDFYVPEIDEMFIKDFKEKNLMERAEVVIKEEKKIIILPHQNVLIPSGIKANIPRGYALIAFNKSGMSTRTGMDVLASVVDEDYQGEIHISLSNICGSYMNISSNEKIIQFILLPVNYCNIVEAPLKELYSFNTERGTGGFGSTGA